LSSSISSQERLEEALRKFADQTRPGRIERTVWLSAHQPEIAAYIGRAETLHLMGDARSVFIHGRYAATLIVALAVIEHCLVEELQLRGVVKSSRGLAEVLGESATCKIIPQDLADQISLLVKRRNPFVHLKPEAHEHNLGVRIQTEKTHPMTLMEGDAKAAISAMYKVFLATLREAA
jgi:hypothetical protein